MILEITYYGNPILRKKTNPVIDFSPELKTLTQNMIETMFHANGVGIAAPQIGVDLQIFIADITPSIEEVEKKNIIVAINPQLEWINPDKIDIQKEGCLSIPGLYAQVKRYSQVRLKAVDINNNPFTIEATDFIARIFQHEFDHLQGTLFIDKVLATEKKYVNSSLKEIRQKHA